MDHLLSLIARAASALPDDVRPRTVVFGSAPMALAGLPRVPGDLDLFMSREDYLRLLQGGSSDYPLALLQAAGADLTTSRPVTDVLDRFVSLMDQLEEHLETHGTQSAGGG